MTIYNRAAVYVQGTGEWVYLPPFGPLSAAATRRVKSRQYDIAKSSIIDLGARIAGTDIDISGEYSETSYETGLLYQQKLLDTFFDGGTARLVDVQIWDDTTGAIKRVWRNCRIQGDVEFGNIYGEDESNRTFTLSFFTSETAPVSTVTGGLNAPAGPYEEYIYGGAAAAAAVRSYDMFNIVFPAGMVEACDASNASTMQMIVEPSPDRPWRVTGIKIIGCAGVFGTSGSTTIRVSDTDYSSAGNYIDASVAYNESASAIVTGSIYMAAAAQLYIYPTAAAGHSAPVVQINIEVL